MRRRLIPGRLAQRSGHRGRWRPARPDRLTAACVVSVAILAGAAACGSAPVEPLPIQTPGPSAVAPPPVSPTLAATTSAAVTRALPAGTRRTRQPPTERPSTTPSVDPEPSSPRPPSCLGAVRYDVDLSDVEVDMIQSMCFATGGVLSLRGIGPGQVKTEPARLVSQQYEAAVVNIQFLHPGTVEVTIPRHGEPHIITVVVRESGP